MPTTLIAAYWSARADDLALCTSNAVRHFRFLVNAGEGLDRWFRKAWRKPTVPSEVDVFSTKDLAELLSKGANRRDTDRSVITELGWSLSLWNGDLHGLSASTSLHCGCTSDRVGNSAIVEVRRDDSWGIEDSTAVELLKALVEIWDADSGVVSRATWHEERQERDTLKIASYERRRWPLLFPKGALRHANGIIKLVS